MSKLAQSREDKLYESVGILADSIAALTIRLAALEERIGAVEERPALKLPPLPDLGRLVGTFRLDEAVHKIDSEKE